MKSKLNNCLLKESILPTSDYKFFDLILVMTLLMFLYITNDLPLYAIFIPLFTIPAILFERIRQSYFIWVFIFLYFGWFYIFKGTERYVPNHKYLYFLFTLLIIITLYARKKSKEWFYIFKSSCQYMIGFIFLLATIGKFLAPEFLNGTFFKFTLLTDERFFNFTEIVGGIDKAKVWSTYHEFLDLKTTSNSLESIQLPDSNRLNILALYLSYWTILIEGAIALTFLVKESFVLSKYRNWVLLIFIVTTYPIATVPGFAILLALLAFISVRKTKSEKVWKLVYLITFMLIPLFKIPFMKIFETLL